MDIIGNVECCSKNTQKGGNKKSLQQKKVLINNDVEKLNQEIEQMRKSGATQSEINKKLKELERKTKELNETDEELSNLIQDITLLDMSELNEKINNVKNEINLYKKEIQTILTMQLKPFEKSLQMLEEKLKDFNMRPTYISLNNRRLVKSADGIDAWDLVTKSQLDNAIKNRLKRSLDQIATFKDKLDTLELNVYGLKMSAAGKIPANNFEY